MVLSVFGAGFPGGPVEPLGVGFGEGGQQIEKLGGPVLEGVLQGAMQNSRFLQPPGGREQQLNFALESSGVAAHFHVCGEGYPWMASMCQGSGTGLAFGHVLVGLWSSYLIKC